MMMVERVKAKVAVREEHDAHDVEEKKRFE